MNDCLFLKNSKCYYKYILAAISATGSHSRPVRKTLSTSQPRSKPFKRISVDTESDKTYQNFCESPQSFRGRTQVAFITETLFFDPQREILFRFFDNWKIFVSPKNWSRIFQRSQSNKVQPVNAWPKILSSAALSLCCSTFKIRK